jgi:hypothetical protein
MQIANTDAAGVDQQSMMAALLPGDVLHLDHVDDPDGWWVYTVAEAPTSTGTTPPVAATHLVVDNYSGGFIRVRPAPDTATTVDFALATTPGPGGAVYPGINDIPNAAVWADFAGNLGKLKNPDGSDVTGNTLKQWMRSGAVFNVHKDATDPAHPNLVADGEVPAPPPTDATSVKVTSGGHGPTVNPSDGDDLLVTFMFMAGPTEPTPSGPIDLDTLRVRLVLPVSVISDDELQSILDAALGAQQAACDTTVRTEGLDRALIRRVGRGVAARGLPLGAQDTEYGQQFIPRWDPILQELEAPYLLGGFA